MRSPILSSRQLAAAAQRFRLSAKTEATICLRIQTPGRTTRPGIRFYASTTAAATPPAAVDPLALISRELGSLRSSVQTLVDSDRPRLDSLAHYYFKGSGGKGVRPGIVMLVSRAAAPSADIVESDRQIRLAEITELIHVASLLHDDVIDHADSRRGLPSAPSEYGNKLTVLGGDFLLARASLHLARLGDLQVVELMASALGDLVEGEVLQMQDDEATRDGQWTAYMRKMFLKTASLIAKSAKSAVVLGGGDEAAQEAAFNFGRHLGLAFQVRTLDSLSILGAADELTLDPFHLPAHGRLARLHPTCCVIREASLRGPLSRSGHRPSALCSRRATSAVGPYSATLLARRGCGVG